MKDKFLNKIPSQVKWIVLGLFIGFFVGYMSTQWSYFSINKQLDLVSVISLFITSSIGVYIATSLRKNIDSLSYEKTTLIQQLRDIEKRTETILKFLTSNSLDQQLTTNHFKSINSMISSLKSHNSICCILKQDAIDTLQNRLFELKKLITGSNIVEKQFVLSDAHKGMATNNLENIQKEIVNLIMRVNRH